MGAPINDIQLLFAQTSTERGNAHGRKAKPREGARPAEKAGRAKREQIGLSRGDPVVSKTHSSGGATVKECGGHCMRKAATGHRLTTAGIAGDTSVDTETRQSNHHIHRSDPKIESGNARAKGKHRKQVSSEPYPSRTSPARLIHFIIRRSETTDCIT